MQGSIGRWVGGRIGGRLDADQGDRPSCGTRRGGRTGGRAARGAEERTFQSALLETRGTSCLLTCTCLPALPGPARAELHLGSSRAAWQQLASAEFPLASTPAPADGHLARAVCYHWYGTYSSSKLRVLRSSTEGVLVSQQNP